MPQQIKIAAAPQNQVSHLPSTVALDLTTLPERLDDETYRLVQEIAHSPLPAPTPCDEKHLSKCLRVMLAVLPRQASDEISGELFVAAYQRKLGHLPNDAVSFIADQAMERCKWFPTIAECIEIGSDWRRRDEHTERKTLALQIARKEREAREKDKRDHELMTEKPWGFKMSQAFIDQMSPEIVKLGLSCGALELDATGKVVEAKPKPEPGEDWVF